MSRIKPNLDAFINGRVECCLQYDGIKIDFPDRKLHFLSQRRIVATLDLPKTFTINDTLTIESLNGYVDMTLSN